MKKLVVNQQACIGCGACVSLATKSFKLNENNKAQAINPPGDDEATVKNALESCPVNSISWEKKNE